MDRKARCPYTETLGVLGVELFAVFLCGGTNGTERDAWSSLFGDFSIPDPYLLQGQGPPTDLPAAPVLVLTSHPSEHSLMERAWLMPVSL